VNAIEIKGTKKKEGRFEILAQKNATLDV